MSRALVVSQFIPLNDRAVHGVVQRLGMQVQALARVVDEVECLALVPELQEFTSEELQRHARRLCERWSANVTIRIANVVRQGVDATSWQLYGRGIYDLRALRLIHPVSTPAALDAVRSALQRDPDLVLMHKLSAMSVLERLPRSLLRAPVFFDLDDVEHLVMLRRLIHSPDWPMERLTLLQVPNLMRVERAAIRRSAATFVCSERDRRHLVRMLGVGDRVRVIPNNVPFPPQATRDATEALVLFVGVLHYPPNAQAADVLVQQIWPRVRSQVPNARLVIAGNHREAARSYPSSDPSVTFAGFIEDLSALYRQARVVCCPIFLGSGTRIKIIEAAAHSCPVITTPLGAEGLELEDGQEIILRAHTDEIAAECVRLLKDPVAAERLGRAAHDSAMARYDRSSALDRLEELFAGTLGASAYAT